MVKTESTLPLTYAPTHPKVSPPGSPDRTDDHPNPEVTLDSCSAPPTPSPVYQPVDLAPDTSKLTFSDIPEGVSLDQALAPTLPSICQKHLKSPHHWRATKDLENKPNHLTVA